MNLKKLTILSLIITLMSSCQPNKENTVTTSKPQNELSFSAQDTLDSMSLKEKIGQLFIVRPESLDFSLNSKQVHDPHQYGLTNCNENMLSALKDYPVGGIVMFSKNITSPSQIQSFIHNFQKNSDIPLFMGVDEEGGQVSRIASTNGFQVKKYKSMTEIGDTNNPDNAKNVGIEIGKYLHEYGFNLDFAPDADINTNPHNPIIGTRSFGSDPQLVGKMVSAAIEGFHSSDIMTCIKHFPGHGDTQTDTHLGYASTNKNWQEMLKCEMIPFQMGIEAKTDMVMVSHITAVNVSSDQLPASLSYEMITEKLRHELNYDGIVITDSLAMQAITKQYNSKETAIKTIQAGSDILLMPDNYKEAFDGLMNAVKNGIIDEQQIDQSVLKILQLKEKYLF